MVIVEYCVYGSLERYLRQHQHYFIDQIDPRTGMINPKIGRERLQSDDVALALEAQRDAPQG